eukprot:GHVR01143033.1.p1 GENE.GHVR01143033.1~~GHVR01143033.1.p1  ORF type:complete len:420 (+),score=52.09 GHVR01143033.1:3-1262(+)
MKGDNDDTDNKNDDTGNKNDDTGNKNDDTGNKNDDTDNKNDNKNTPNDVNDDKNIEKEDDKNVTENKDDEEKDDTEKDIDDEHKFEGKGPLRNGIGHRSKHLVGYFKALFASTPYKIYINPYTPVQKELTNSCSFHVDTCERNLHSRPLLIDDDEQLINARLMVDFSLVAPLKNNGGGKTRPELRPFTFVVDFSFIHLFLPLAEYDVGEFSMGVYVDSRDVNWCGASGLAVSDSEFFPRCVIELGGCVAAKFVNMETSTPDKLALDFTTVLKNQIIAVKKTPKLSEDEQCALSHFEIIIRALCTKSDGGPKDQRFGFKPVLQWETQYCVFIITPLKYAHEFRFSNGYDAFDLGGDYSLMIPSRAFRVALLQMTLGIHNSSSNYEFNADHFKQLQSTVSKYEKKEYEIVKTLSMNEYITE